VAEAEASTHRHRMAEGAISLRERAGKQAPHGASLRLKIPRLDRATDSDGFEEVAGVLIELPGTREFGLLEAARVQAAIVMLRRSGFNLVLLPNGAAVQLERKSRRRWWRRPEWRQER